MLAIEKCAFNPCITHCDRDHHHPPLRHLHPYHHCIFIVSAYRGVWCSVCGACCYWLSASRLTVPGVELTSVWISMQSSPLKLSHHILYTTIIFGIIIFIVEITTFTNIQSPFDSFVDFVSVLVNVVIFITHMESGGAQTSRGPLDTYHIPLWVFWWLKVLGLVQADLNKGTSIESNDIVKVQEFDKVKEFSIMAAGEMCIFFLCVLFQHIKPIPPYQQYHPNEPNHKRIWIFSGGSCESLFPCLLSMGIAARCESLSSSF